MLKNYFKLAFKVLLRRKFYTFISLFGISFTMAVLMLVVAFAGWSAREQVGNPRADVLVSAFPFVGICVVASLIALFRKPHAAAPANYLPFLVLGVLLTAGGGFGVNWLEAEYDKHVILLYEYKPATTLAPVAAQSGQPQNRTDSEDVDGRK